MNANEVIANRAIELLGGQRGDKALVHPERPREHGAEHQRRLPDGDPRRRAWTRSSAMLLPALRALADAFEAKAHGVRRRRQGRPHAPAGRRADHARAGVLRLRQRRPPRHRARREYAARIWPSCRSAARRSAPGINAHPELRRARASTELRAPDGPSAFARAENPFEAMQNRDAAVELSGALRTIAVGLMKIANDLRLLTSGPRTGLNEIELPATQPGSSIMPGKVNPVIPEAVNMVAALLIGNDATIAVAGHERQPRPERHDAGDRARPARMRSSCSAARPRCSPRSACAASRPTSSAAAQYAELTGQLVTAIAPVVGYDAAAKIFKKALARGRADPAGHPRGQAASRRERSTRFST